MPLRKVTCEKEHRASDEAGEKEKREKDQMRNEETRASAKI
jgi:hypothetical protein